MIPDPLPGQGDDDREPDGSGSQPAGNGPENPDGAAYTDALAAAAEASGCEMPPEEAEQGLFVCLPAEQLDVAGFVQDGQSDTMAPGPLLAAVVHALTGDDGAGLSALSDDQLMGIIAATQRLESRVAWTQMAAVRELAARRPGSGSGRLSEFAADELADELHLTWQSASGQIDYVCAVAQRLPSTFAALAAGRIHPVHVRIIEDETSILSPENAAKADETLAEAAQGKTFGELRYAAHRLVLKLDPESARRRKEAAKKEAHVRRFAEQSGNAGMVARELPPDEILASWQHVEQRALDLRAAGVPGTLRELRVRAYLDLLQERDSRAALGDSDGRQAARSAVADDAARPDDAQDAGQPDGHGSGGGPDGNGGGPAAGGPDGNGRGPAAGGPDGNGRGPAAGGPDGTVGTGTARTGSRDPGPSLAALVNITVPWSTVLGKSEIPADVGGLGMVDAETARDLMAAATRHPATRWCVTALDPDGTAAAHGCVSGRPPPPGSGDNGPRGRPDAAGRPTPDYLHRLKITFYPVIRGPCDHSQAEDTYRPSRKLQHLVRVRNGRCTAPGCGRPAARCDLDHTKPWHRGGITCPCDLAPLCRHHHRCKQAEGWWLEQPEPGVLRWRSPAGRTYATTPTQYLTD
jgi:hypothetical protein